MGEVTLYVLSVRIEPWPCPPRAIRSAVSGVCPIHTVIFITGAASERRGGTLKRFEIFYLKAKAIIWP
jgi:hypothetical protein